MSVICSRRCVCRCRHCRYNDLKDSWNGLSELLQGLNVFNAVVAAAPNNATTSNANHKYGPRRWCQLNIDFIESITLFLPLATYRSALGRWFLEESHTRDGSTGVNPVHDIRVNEVLKGIENEWRSQPRVKVITPSLTPNLLSQLRPHLRDVEPRATMVWAAATLGVGALLRPSEILGSHLHPDRALRADQITFYKSKDSAQIVGLLPPTMDIDRIATPDRYEVRLTITKTTSTETVKTVSGQAMVHALWRWCHLRRSLDITSPLLFVDEGDKRLSIAALLAELQVGFIGLARVSLMSNSPANVSDAAALPSTSTSACQTKK